MKSKRKGTGSGARWAISSLALHALLLTFAAGRPERGAESAGASVSPAELDVDIAPSPVVVENTEPAAATQPSSELAPVAAAAKRGDGAAASGAEELATTDQVSPGEGAEEAPAAAPRASATTPRLGLAQLGLTGPNQFWDRSAPAPAHTPGKPRVNAKRRLDQALAQGQQDEKTALGLGAGGPVMRALETAVRASTAPLNGNALFTFIIDSDGKVVNTSLGDVSAERDKWERVARQVAQALAQRKLPVPKGRSVRLTLSVNSRLELPSGADAGRPSPSVDVLNPLNPAVLLSLVGDVADLGGKARRMVRSHVVSEDLL